MAACSQQSLWQGCVEIVGNSGWAQGMRRDIRMVAKHDATVLIQGPTGTGKELIARWIHALSARSCGPFVAVDCAAMSGPLFASYLFGHQPGAFTGAMRASLGAFRAAEGGTIFLDELGELDVELQAKLLRVLQQRTVVPLGDQREIPVKVRIVAATNRCLPSEVQAGRFRADLFFRLNVITLLTTPLATRLDDLAPLVDHLLHRLEIHHGITRKALSPAAMAALYAHAWPGNTRELQNVLERACIYCRGEMIEPEDLPEPYRPADLGRYPEHSRDAPAASPPSVAAASWLTLEAAMRGHLLATLDRTHFNQTAASRLLAIDRHKLRRLARRLGIDLSPSRRGRPCE